MTENQQQESDFPEAWSPSPGDKLVGKFRDAQMIDPNGRGAYPVLHVTRPDGVTVAVHAFHQILQREIARRAPKPGDELEILYQGKREGGKNGQYHAYRVSGGSTTLDWGQFLPPEEREQALPIAATPPPALNPNGTWAPDTPPAPASPPAAPVAPEDDLPF